MRLSKQKRIKNFEKNDPKKCKWNQYRMRYLVEEMKMQKESRIATEEIGTQI